MLQAGNNGGNWQGAGLMSSAAAANANHYTLGVVDNATNSSHYDVYDGVNTASHQQVLVKFTYVDDLDLDGSVTLNDAVVFGGRFSLGATASYQFGDLNYNGVYDLNYATTFGGAYNTALPPMPVI